MPPHHFQEHYVTSALSFQERPDTFCPLDGWKIIGIGENQQIYYLKLEQSDDNC
jgi:hypothetical protein